MLETIAALAGAFAAGFGGGYALFKILRQPPHACFPATKLVKWLDSLANKSEVAVRREAETWKSDLRKLL